MKKFKLEKIAVYIGIITIIGFVLRLICCYWGYPLPLHTDEDNVVEPIIDMLSRHSWEAFTYNRPDQFEIKCNAILFTIISWIKFHMPAYEAFENHEITFYLAGRIFNAIWGTTLIPLSAVFAGRLLEGLEINKKLVQITIAVITAFSLIFVQHSAYVTPDIMLTFFILLFTYYFIAYMESGKLKYLYICAILTAISISIKYSAAINCLLIAFMIIYRAVWVDKEYKNIIKYGFMSIGLICIVLFIIAPNLFTDIVTVYGTFLYEAGSYQLGYDNLSFIGNLTYYIECVIQNMGYISFVPFIVGLYFIVKNRTRKFWGLIIGPIYWLCLSVLPIHFLRWGIPIFLFYNLIVAIGIAKSVFLIKGMVNHGKFIGSLYKILTWGILGIIVLNTMLSGIAIAKYSSTPDTRTIALEYCSENDINVGNSLYEGYTPLKLDYAKPPIEAFYIADNDVKVNEFNAVKKYYVRSNSFKGRYLGEPDRYADQIVFYAGLDENYNIIYEKSGNGNYSQEPCAIKNIFFTVRYLFADINAIGSTIYVYDLKPQYAYIKPAKNILSFLAADNIEKTYEINISNDKYLWTIYEHDNDDKYILSVKENMALDVAEEHLEEKVTPELQNIAEGQMQGWKLIQSGENYFIMTTDGFALTYDENNKTVFLDEFKSSEEQKWMITYVQ